MRYDAKSNQSRASYTVHDERDEKMAKAKRKEKKRKLPLVLGGIGLTVASCVVFPIVINGLSRKIYRASSSTADIDFSELGPEIVKIKEDGKRED